MYWAHSACGKYLLLVNQKCIRLHLVLTAGGYLGVLCWNLHKCRSPQAAAPGTEQGWQGCGATSRSLAGPSTVPVLLLLPTLQDQSADPARLCTWLRTVSQA